MRRSLSAFTAALVLFPLGAVPVAPVGAAPAVADVQVVLDGHGYGHGIGLSQWGAYGYAVDRGWTALQILDHYYGGTVSATSDVASIVVRLQNLDGAQTAVVSETGGIVVDGIAGGPWKSALAREVSPGVYSVWARADAQVCPATGGDPAASGWAVVATTLTATVTFRTQVDSNATVNYGDLLAVCEPGGNVRSYRGAIRAVNDSIGANRTVNEVAIEQYLRAVIAKETSPSWATAGGGRGAQALQAQAVAARSYAIAENRYSYARTCDLVCQAYYGAAMRSSVTSSYVRVEYPGTDAAVAATAGVVRRVGSASGPVAYAMFSASSGGWTAPSTLPFPAVLDEGDATTANPNHRWSATLSGSAITARYPAIGTFTRLTVLARNGYGDWGGRVMSIRVEGSASSVTVTGDAFRSAMGLKSNWFNVRGAEVPGSCEGRVAPPVGAAPPAAAGARFTPLSPLRLIDTRTATGTQRLPLGAGCTMVVDPGVAEGVTAVAVNITAVRPVTKGYLTAYPCGVERPVVSVVQALAGRAVAGMAVVPLGADGTFCVYSNITLDLVVDLFGSYSPEAGVPFEPLAAVRLSDSRGGAVLPAGSTVELAVTRPLGAPAGATAAALTLHLTTAAAAGYATVYPCSTPRPVVSSANVAAGGSVTNHVQTRIDPAGTVCVYISAPMHVVVDLSGWFGSAATTEFYAVTPVRIVDTRTGLGWSGAFAGGQTRALTVAGVGGLPAGAAVRSLVAEVTAVAPAASGYLTVHPCQTPVPSLSMVRYASGSNAATTVAGVLDGSGRWCLTASSSTQVLIDVNGYFR